MSSAFTFIFLGSGGYANNDKDQGQKNDSHRALELN